MPGQWIDSPIAGDKERFPAPPEGPAALTGGTGCPFDAPRRTVQTQ